MRLRPVLRFAVRIPGPRESHDAATGVAWCHGRTGPHCLAQFYLIPLFTPPHTITCTILLLLSLPFRMAVLTDFNDLSARSLSSRLTPNDTQRITLIVAGCYIIIIGILWYALSLLLSLLSITELPVNESLQACAIFELYQCVVTSPVFPLSLTVVLMRITVYQFIRSSECSRM